MKNVYPIVISKGVKKYIVYVPDFDINTEGDTIADAIQMARDAIAMCGCYKEDNHEEVPSSQSLDAKKTNPHDIVTLVDVDFEEYRRKNDMRSIRKNCTIPSWLNDEAEKANINFSRVLQDALKEELQIHGK